jgi:hypothetical protein
LALGVFKSPSVEPIIGGLRATHLGTYTSDIDRGDLIEQLRYAIEEVCPNVEVVDDVEPERVEELRSYPTMTSVVEYDGFTCSVGAHAERLGLSFKTVETRLQQAAMADLGWIFRPKCRTVTPHFNARRGVSKPQRIRHSYARRDVQNYFANFDVDALPNNSYSYRDAA